MTVDQLAGAVLGVLGKNVTCISMAREHGRVIDQILSHDISAALRTQMLQRRDALMSRWGGWREEDLNSLKVEPVSPAIWLAKRRQRERTFYTLKAASRQLLEGETGLTRIMVRAYCASGQTLIAPVGLDAFRLWLLRTGVATHVGRGEYMPGVNAKRIAAMDWPEMYKEIEETTEDAAASFFPAKP